MSVSEFEFQDYNGRYKPGDEKRPDSVYLTCKNHTFLRWSTKNPYQRHIHYLGLADDVEVTKENGKYLWTECECPLSELVVILEEESEDKATLNN